MSQMSSERPPKQVYVLVDPVSELPRYVGMSSDPQRRYYQRLRDCFFMVDNDIYPWLLSCLRAGTPPRLVVLPEVEADAGVQEEAVIAEYRGRGYALFNRSSGGWAGAKGVTRSPETKAKVSLAIRESLARRKATGGNLGWSPERRARQAAKMTELGSTRWTPEMRAKAQAAGLVGANRRWHPRDDADDPTL